LINSSLELLIAVPYHFVVRQPDECTAPAMTYFGVVTGIAIMLLSFGPSVPLLYEKQMNQYKETRPSALLMNTGNQDRKRARG
jgi:hypothetical protein